MLNKFLYTKVEEKDSGYIWFQEDGATCRTTAANLNVLRVVFENRIIGRDLTPLAY